MNRRGELAKRKLFVLIMLIAVVALTGCSKGVKEADGKTTFTCVKKGIERTSTLTKAKYTEDVTNQAKLDDNGKLTYYKTEYKYTYDSKEACEEDCSATKDWNDEINKNNYAGGHRETTCSCDKKEYKQAYIYDDIPNLANILRSDLTHLNEDNTFKIDEWVEHYEKYKYNCD